MQHQPKIWLITGISSGFGKALAEAVIAKGDFVVGTFRQAEQVQTFNAHYAGKALAYQLDVTQHEAAASIVGNIIEKFGQIDVLVNNAGYGLLGAVEEASMLETRAQMETNFFGALNMTQKVLPFMRQQGSGHILQISSVLGLVPSLGAGIYNASKFALEGFSQTLALEVQPLNIKITIIEPGPFRTQFLAGSLKQTEKKINAYDATAGTRAKQLLEHNGKQEGDPQKAALAMIKVVYSENPPLNFPLGKIAIGRIRDQMNRIEQDLATWEEVSVNTDFI
jgi:NAD(P)-dependent dehydrogenase (short-subunit alcohol dehydrogenase family)